MLTAQELRIGNWVMNHHEDGNPKPVKVDGVFRDRNGFKGYAIQSGPLTGLLSSDIADDPYFSPIPLTPEILEKAGFELHENSNEFYDHWVHKTGWHFSIWKKDEQVAGFEEKGVGYWGEIYVAVRSIHQLQNLFHALTGEELEVNL